MGNHVSLLLGLCAISDRTLLEKQSHEADILNYLKLSNLAQTFFAQNKEGKMKDKQ